MTIIVTHAQAFAFSFRPVAVIGEGFATMKNGSNQYRKEGAPAGAPSSESASQERDDHRYARPGVSYRHRGREIDQKSTRQLPVKH